MAWVIPIIHAVGEVLTSSDWNVTSNDLSFNYGDAAWSGPALAGTWVNFGAGYQNAGYRAFGPNVQLRGVIKSGTINTTAFTLPVGYRPQAIVLLVTQSAGAFAQMSIATTGIVTPLIGSTVSFSLDCLFSVLP